MLGFTRLVSSSKSQVWAVWSIIIITLLALVAMFDAYFFHQIKSFISPLQRNDIQNCAMTYSFPKYIEINNVESPFVAKYKLYIYRDGYRDSETLYGTPALFIPGQAGSYGQIRSLASTTTNLFHENQGLRKNIDFFTVDLNEELSALNGQNLIDQATYLNAVIKRIQDLYQRPLPVMIIGHSMGGIVARSMFLQPNYIPSSIDTIVTIATPHLAAPLLLDTVIYKTYRDITKYWSKHQYDTLKDVTLISIAGGSLDNIIHSDGVSTDSVVPESNGFTTYTTSIPNVWTGSDHMAILWCKQFIQLLSSTLLQVVNSENTVQERMRVFEYNLLRGTRIQGQNELTDISKIAIKNVKPSVRNLFQETEPSITFIPIPQKLQLLTNVPSQFDTRWSIVGCKGSGIEKLVCDYIKPNVTLLPSATAKNLIGSNPYRLLEIMNNKNSRYEYIGVVDHGGQRITDGDNLGFLIGYTTSDTPTVHPYTVWDIIYNGARIHVDTIHNTHMFPFLRNSLFAFDVDILSINKTGLFKPMMQQAINGKEQKYFRELEEGVSDRITFHQEPSKDNKGLSLQFFMDSEAIDISIKLDWYGTLGRCVLRYGSIIILFFWSISLLVLLSQLYSYVINGKREFIRFEVALWQCSKGLFLQIITLLLLVSAIQFYFPFNLVFKNILFGTDDWMMVCLLLFTFLLSVGLTLVIWFTICFIVSILSIPLRLFPMQVQPQKPSIRTFVIHLTLSVPLLGFIPSSVLFLAYSIIWILMTTMAHLAARSDLPKIRNVYYYRLSWLVFLTSLLPYYVPSVIVFVKDIMIGWTQYKVSPVVLVQDIPALLTIIYLVTLGKNPGDLEQKFINPIIYIMNCIIVYQLLFGFLHPFLLQQLL